MAAIDKANASNGITDPSSLYFAVTTSDTADSGDMAYVSRALYIGVGGDLVAVRTDGTEVTFVGVAAGTIVPIRAKRVKATGTTAASIVALA